MRGLADGAAPVSAGPIGRCYKRGWCRAILTPASSLGAAGGPTMFELTAAGRALIAADDK